MAWGGQGRKSHDVSIQLPVLRSTRGDTGHTAQSLRPESPKVVEVRGREESQACCPRLAVPCPTQRLPAPGGPAGTGQAESRAHGTGGTSSPLSPQSVSGGHCGHILPHFSQAPGTQNPRDWLGQPRDRHLAAARTCLCLPCVLLRRLWPKGTRGFPPIHSLHLNQRTVKAGPEGSLRGRAKPWTSKLGPLWGPPTPRP